MCHPADVTTIFLAPLDAARLYPWYGARPLSHSVTVERATAGVVRTGPIRALAW
jgi:hypothetical protein